MGNGISSGVPQPGGFNDPNLRGRGAGYEYRDRRVDDETALAVAKDLRPDQGTLRDAAALEIQFDRFANGLASPDEYAVPGWVAQNGLDAGRQQGVEQMMRAMGEEAGLEPGVTDTAIGMYRDGIAAQRRNAALGLSPYGDRHGELGQW